MGGFLGIGGSSAKTDRKTQLTGFSNLNNLFNFGLDTTKGLLSGSNQTTSQGVSALGDSLSHFMSLMKGNRTAVSADAAPQTNTALAQSDAVKKQAATMGTGRTGGTAAANRDVQDKTMANIDNFLFGEESAAGKEVSSIGSALSSVGIAQGSEALGFGNLSEKSESDMTSDAGSARPVDYGINQDTVGNVTGAIEGVLSKIPF
jgi:hypothetical protein